MALLIFQSTAARTRMITTNLRHRNDQWLNISIVGFRPDFGYGVNTGLVTARALISDGRYCLVATFAEWYSPTASSCGLLGRTMLSHCSPMSSPMGLPRRE